MNNNTGDNPDGDPWLNFVEFAFGTDPTSPSATGLTYVANGDVTGYGLPVIENTGSVMRIVFLRHKQHAAAGLTYTALFSHNLTQWASVATTPTLLTNVSSSGDYEAVCIEFPALLNIGGSDEVPIFGVIEVDMGP